jgi:son of sevenless-like protein
MGLWCLLTVDLPFNTTFLMTYRTFTTSAQLFDLLVKRYLIQPPDNLTDQSKAWDEKQKFIRIRSVGLGQDPGRVSSC